MPKRSNPRRHSPGLARDIVTPTIREPGHIEVRRPVLNSDEITARLNLARAANAPIAIPETYYASFMPTLSPSLREELDYSISIGHKLGVLVTNNELFAEEHLQAGRLRNTDYGRDRYGINLHAYVDFGHEEATHIAKAISLNGTACPDRQILVGRMSLADSNVRTANQITLQLNQLFKREPISLDLGPLEVFDPANQRF